MLDRISWKRNVFATFLPTRILFAMVFLGSPLEQAFLNVSNP